LDVGAVEGSPDNPVKVADYRSLRVFKRLTMAGGLLYASTRKGPVRIFRAQPAQTPPLRPVGLTAQQGNTSTRHGLALYGDRLLRGRKGGGLSVFQARPTLDRKATAAQGDTLSYTVAWSPTLTGQAWDVDCAVTSGSCSVDSVDAANQTATVSWSGYELGDQELRVGVGNALRFFSLRDRVTVQ
jgi:hypothetical protein